MGNEFWVFIFFIFLLNGNSNKFGLFFVATPEPATAQFLYRTAPHVCLGPVIAQYGRS